jgi:hypothetical protein
MAFAVLPFETLWMNARAGHLQVGDAAPEFNLKTLDGTRQRPAHSASSPKGWQTHCIAPPRKCGAETNYISFPYRALRL